MTVNKPAYPSKERFQALLHYFTQNRFEKIAGAIPQEFLDTPVVLGMTASRTSQKISVPMISASVLLDGLKGSDAMIVQGHEMPYSVGSRPDYNVVMIFDNKKAAREIEELLGITTYDVMPFSAILQASTQADWGICLWNNQTISIIEADRVNEYARASLPTYEQTYEGDVHNALTDLSDAHNLRPEELKRLEALIDEKDWIESISLGSGKFKGMKSNVLAVVPKPGMSREQFSELCKQLGKEASEIKTPFIVLPLQGKDPIGRDSL